MRITVKSGVAAALFWIIFKLTLYFLGFSDETTFVAVLTNIFMLLSAISIGLYLQKRIDTDETNAMVDLKNAMSAGVPYVLITSIFLFFFYSKINPGYYAQKIAEKEYEIHQMVNDSAQLEKFKQEFPDAEVMTKDQIEKKLIENNKKGASVGFTTTLTILSMLLLSTFYSIMITIIYRKIVFKD
ncbi:MAG: DUF4199 family protein [Cryomorphaceae bacterium]|jgi:hypothetical protein|nr:DUF4199 family protein [Cryomorphaceae bacterium]